MKTVSAFAISLLFSTSVSAQDRLAGSVVESFVENPPVSSGGLLVGASIAGADLTDTVAFDALRLAVPRSAAAQPACLYATTRDGRYSAESVRLEIAPGGADLLLPTVDGFGQVVQSPSFPSYTRAEFATLVRIGGPCSGNDAAPIFPVTWDGEAGEALHLALNSGGGSIRSLDLHLGDLTIEGTCRSDVRTRSVGFDQLCSIPLPSTNPGSECAGLTIRYRPPGVFRATTEEYDISIGRPPSVGCLAE